MSHLNYKEMIAIDNIEYCYNKCLKGSTRYTRDAIEFQRDETYNILQLKQELKNKTYKHSGYNEFTVYEPKERLIHAPYFKDKIVQIMLYYHLSEHFNPKFIKTSFGSIHNKGMHRCLYEVQSSLRIAKRNYSDPWILKTDISKFYYSIDRDVMKSRLNRYIYDKDLMWLLCTVIDSANMISPKGLPLGNTSSQVLANIYMDKLDKYCKNKLSIKHYIRYMDDIVIICDNKEEAKRMLNKVRFYTETRLKLKLNTRKTKIFPLEQGVNMVGFKIYPTHILLSDRSKKSMKKKMKKLQEKFLMGHVGKEEVEAICNSWYGHARHSNSYNMVNSWIDKLDIYEMNNGKICVKEGFDGLF